MSGSSGNSSSSSMGSYNNNAQNQKQGSSTYGQNVWNSGALNNMYNNAASMWGNGGQYGRQSGQAAQAGNMANQGNLQGGVYGNLGIGNQLMSSLNESQNKPSNTSSVYANIMGGQGNNYADAMKQQYLTDAGKAQKQMMGNISADAAGSGMSGSSREGVAQAMGMQDINSNLQKNMAETGYNTFDKDLQNKLGIAQQADTNIFNRQQLMSGLLGQQQGAINQGISNTGAMQGNLENTGWGSFNNYKNAIGNPTVLNQGGSQNSASGNSSGYGWGGGSSNSKQGGGGI